MDKFSRIGLTIFGIIASVIFIFGFRNLSQAIKNVNHKRCVEAFGTAEKKVKSDIAELKINIKNKSESFENLYRKRVEDKQKVIDFIKGCGITDKEIISITVKSDNKGEKENEWGGTTTSNQETYYSSEDSILIRTTDFDKIEKIKNQIIQLAAKDVIVSYKYKYKILEPERLRAEMMTLAVKNARANAEALVQPLNKTIKDVNRISCNKYDMSIIKETQNDRYSSSDNDNDTINKKVRVDVTAEFSLQ